MRRLFLQPFETGVTETFETKTDIMRSVTRVEQRVALRDYPREYLSTKIRFSGNQEVATPSVVGIDPTTSIVRSYADLINCKNEIEIPAWHLSDYFASVSWDTGSQILNFELNGEFSPFNAYPTERVLVQNGNDWRVASLSSYDGVTREGQLNFGENTGWVISNFKQIVPIRQGILDEDATSNFSGSVQAEDLDFKIRLDAIATRTTVSSNDIDVTSDAQNVSSLTLPVVYRRNNTTILQMSVLQGLQKTDNVSGQQFYRTLWTETGFRFKFTDEFPKKSRAFAWYRQFLDYTKGSQKPFFVPTRRNDFELVSVIGNSGIILKGRSYYDLWFDTNLHAIGLDNGTETIQVRQVSSVELTGSDTLLIFQNPTTLVDPPKQISICYPCRISGDSIKFAHTSRSVIVEFECETFNLDYSETSIPSPLVDLSSDDPAATTSPAFLQSLPNHGSLGGNFTALVTGNRPDAAVLWEGKRSAFFGNSDALHTSLASSAFDFLLDPAAQFTLTVRFYGRGATGNSRYLISSDGTPFFRIGINANGSITVDRRTRVFTTVAATVTENESHTLQLRCGPTRDWLYLDGVLVGSSTNSWTAVALGGLFSVGRPSGTLYANAEITRVLIHPATLSLSQMEVIRTQVEEQWPDKSNVIARFDASDEFCEFTSLQQYVSIPAKGSKQGCELVSLTSMFPYVAAVNSRASCAFTSSATERGPLRSQGISPVLWAVAYDMTVNWKLTLVARFGLLTNYYTLFQVLATSPLRGCTVQIDATEIVVTFDGTSGTFAGSVALPYSIENKTVVIELALSDSPRRLDVVIDGSHEGTITASSFVANPSNSNIQAVSIGDSSSQPVKFCEMILRSEHLFDYLNMLAKWGS